MAVTRSLAVMVVVALWAAGAEAEEFVVRTTIHADGRGVVAENLTIFGETKVYDVALTEPGEASVFDPAAKTIELLAPARGVRATLSLTSLLQFVAALQTRATQASPLVKFAASPEFTITESRQRHTLRLASDWMEYEVRADECSDEIVRRYTEFADWYARLNATIPGALPPAARLELNRQLGRRNWLPVEIQLALRSESSATTLRSQHTLVHGLEEEHQERVRTIEEWRRKFRLVDLAEFRG